MGRQTSRFTDLYRINYLIQHTIIYSDCIRIIDFIDCSIFIHDYQGNTCGDPFINGSSYRWTMAKLFGRKSIVSRMVAGKCGDYSAVYSNVCYGGTNYFIDNY